MFFPPPVMFPLHASLTVSNSFLGQLQSPSGHPKVIYHHTYTYIIHVFMQKSHNETKGKAER